MSVGHGLIAAGALMAAMSVGAWSRVLSAPADPITTEPLSCAALRVGWALACLPYTAESRTAHSVADAYSCLDRAEPLD